MSTTKQGILFALGAFIIWGIFPVYLKCLEHIPAGEILAYRIIWSAVFMGILISLTKSWKKVWEVLHHPKTVLTLTITALLIASNWLIYIYAVNNKYMLEASLGYFINPLVNVLLGVLFLKERMRRTQWIAVALAATGVFIQLWTLGSLPLIALGLAFSFGTYGLIRKKLAVDGQSGLMIETVLLTPLALAYLIFLVNGAWENFSGNISTTLLLMGTGIVTSVPLLFFNGAATRLRLSTLGFFQYLSPTIVFLLAVLVYGEHITLSRIITFAFIWTALGLFVADAIYTQKRLLQSNAGYRY